MKANNYSINWKDIWNFPLSKFEDLDYVYSSNGVLAVSNFKDEWSRIDNMFAAGSADFIDFFPAAEGNWCESDTCIPKRYSLWNGTGYSDHLPIVGIVQF